MMKTESKKRWIDPSFLYIKNEDEWEILDDVPAESDGYPGYLIRGRRSSEEGEIRGPRFTIRDRSVVSEINNDESLFDVAPFGSKRIVIPGYIVSDYANEEDRDGYDELYSLRIEKTHAPLDWVEVLFIPFEMDVSIEDRRRVFPSLTGIFFYTPGVIESGYTRRELEEVALDPEAVPEIYPHDYDYYVLGKNCPYQTERVEGEKFLIDDVDEVYCMLISREEYEKGYYQEKKDIYDVIFPNMIFRFDAVRQTATLTYVSIIEGGRLVVPDYIKVNGQMIPVSGIEDFCDLSGECVEVKFEELELPRDCNIDDLSISSGVAIIFRR